MNEATRDIMSQWRSVQSNHVSTYRRIEDHVLEQN